MLARVGYLVSTNNSEKRFPCRLNQRRLRKEHIDNLKYIAKYHSDYSFLAGYALQTLVNIASNASERVQHPQFAP